MAHVYATVGSLKKTIVEGGDDYGTQDDPLLLSALGSASRSIDAWCRRTGRGHAPSGFGPVQKVNYYDGPGGRILDLRDDLLSVSSVTVADSFGSTPITYTDETDFLKLPYGGPRYRELVLHGDGYTSWYSTMRGIPVTAKWGYQDVRVTSTATTNEALDTTETGVDVTDGTAFEAGQTLLVDSEQMYVKSISTNTLTVERGANGTTAASHSTSAAIDVYQYPDDVVQACRMVALRRWKTRDAGAYVSEFAGGAGPGSALQLSDTAIFRSLLVPYRLVRV